MSKQFKCYQCGVEWTSDPDWTEEKQQAEHVQNFGTTIEEMGDCVKVCTDCYEAIMKCFTTGQVTLR